MFKKGESPLVCSFIQEDNTSDAIKYSDKAVKDGADVVGLQLEVLKPQFRTLQDVKRIINSIKVPVYLTDYVRFDKWLKEPYEDKAKMLLYGAECGAELIDIPGNMFSDDVLELTYDNTAIRKQKELISKIHELNKHVLVSTHLLQYTEEEEILRIVLSQQERGADVCKIVTMSNTDEQLLKNLDTVSRLYERLSVPFVFVTSGEKGLMHRLLGPYFGSCMWFCASHYGKYDMPNQPLIKDVKMIQNLFAIKEKK